MAWGKSQSFADSNMEATEAETKIILQEAVAVILSLP